MTKTTMRSLCLLPLACAALALLAQPGLGQKLPGRHEEATPPIQLGDITVEYLVQNDAGQFAWQSPEPGNPNAIPIPAGAQRLRLTASVLNRDNGSTVRFRAALQEVCRSGKGGRAYITRLRHLTESDPTGGLTGGEATDDELRVVEGGKVSIELPVHCEDCVRASCGRECEGRDHLGEGPHVVIVTTSDPSPSDPQNGPASRVAGGQSATAAAAAKPSSYRLDVMSVCPKPGAGKSRASKPRPKKRGR